MNSIFGQLIFVDKAFTDEKEWRLNFKLGNAYFSKSYNFCSKCMDELISMTDDMDKRVLEYGIECYDKTYQKHKIEKLIKEGHLDDFTVKEKCEMELSTEIKSLSFFSECNETGATAKKPEIVSKPELRDELINMLIADQYYRSPFILSYLYDLGYETHNEFLEKRTRKALDSINQIKLKRILTEHGFPEKEEVGKWAMEGVYLIIQHAPLELQLKYETRIHQAFEKGDLNSHNYAAMIDRLEIKKGNRQIYGTQDKMNDEGKSVLAPLANPEKVNEKRMTIGLMPLESYMLQFDIKHE